jgi:hypothetical protein
MKNRAKSAILLLLLPTILLIEGSCQCAKKTNQRNTALSLYQKPHTVLVKGRLFMGHDTTRALRGFKVVFSRLQTNHSVESVTADHMPSSGFYQLRLPVGKTYRATLIVAGCQAETQEYAVSNNLTDSVLIKNFYMPYPDSTEYGGCLAGWHPQFITR